MGSFLRTREGADEPPQRLGVDGLGNESVGRDGTEIGASQSAHQDARHVRHRRILVQGLQDLCAAHAGHGLVAQDQLRADLARQEQTGEPISGHHGPAIFSFDDRGN